MRVDRVEPVGDDLEVWLRPRVKYRWRCPSCGERRPRYDAGRTRRWRALDFGRMRVFVVATVPRVRCPEHGVVTAGVPWARSGARHTTAFDQVAAWAAVEMSGTAASRLMRCSWRTIGAIVTRVAADLQAADGDGLDGLRRIGIDEISYRRHHRYLLVVVDHDRRRLVYAVERANKETLHGFFDALGEQRTAALTHISADSARWIAKAVRGRAPQAVLCADPFHIVQWVMDALDQVRRQTWNQVRVRRRRGLPASGEGKRIIDARWALWKNHGDLSDEQQAQLDYIAATHPDLHRAWALKEGLRAVFVHRGPGAIAVFDTWLEQASRSQLTPFVELAAKLRRHRPAITATLLHDLTNALTESLNTKIRLITRRAFGFRNVNALIALARLSLGGNRPQLPT